MTQVTYKPERPKHAVVDQPLLMTDEVKAMEGEPLSLELMLVDSNLQPILEILGKQFFTNEDFTSEVQAGYEGNRLRRFTNGVIADTEETVVDPSSVPNARWPKKQKKKKKKKVEGGEDVKGEGEEQQEEGQEEEEAEDDDEVESRRQVLCEEFVRNVTNTVRNFITNFRQQYFSSHAQAETNLKHDLMQLRQANQKKEGLMQKLARSAATTQEKLQQAKMDVNDLKEASHGMSYLEIENLLMKVSELEQENEYLYQKAVATQAAQGMSVSRFGGATASKVAGKLTKKINKFQKVNAALEKANMARLDRNSSSIAGAASRRVSTVPLANEALRTSLALASRQESTLDEDEDDEYLFEEEPMPKIDLMASEEERTKAEEIIAKIREQRRQRRYHKIEGIANKIVDRLIAPTMEKFLTLGDIVDTVQDAASKLPEVNGKPSLVFKLDDFRREIINERDGLVREIKSVIGASKEMVAKFAQILKLRALGNKSGGNEAGGSSSARKFSDLNPMATAISKARKNSSQRATPIPSPLVSEGEQPAVPPLATQLDSSQPPPKLVRQDTPPPSKSILAKAVTATPPPPPRTPPPPPPPSTPPRQSPKPSPKEIILNPAVGKGPSASPMLTVIPPPGEDDWQLRQKQQKSSQRRHLVQSEEDLFLRPLAESMGNIDTAIDGAGDPSVHSALENFFDHSLTSAVENGNEGSDDEKDGSSRIGEDETPADHVQYHQLEMPKNKKKKKKARRTPTASPLSTPRSTTCNRCCCEKCGSHLEQLCPVCYAPRVMKEPAAAVSSSGLKEMLKTALNVGAAQQELKHLAAMEKDKYDKSVDRVAGLDRKVDDGGKKDSGLPKKHMWAPTTFASGLTAMMERAAKIKAAWEKKREALIRQNQIISDFFFQHMTFALYGESHRLRVRMPSLEQLITMAGTLQEREEERARVMKEEAERQVQLEPVVIGLTPDEYNAEVDKAEKALKEGQPLTIPTGDSYKHFGGGEKNHLTPLTTMAPPSRGILSRKGRGAIAAQQATTDSTIEGQELEPTLLSSQKEVARQQHQQQQQQRAMTANTTLPSLTEKLVKLHHQQKEMEAEALLEKIHSVGGGGAFQEQTAPEQFNSSSSHLPTATKADVEAVLLARSKKSKTPTAALLMADAMAAAAVSKMGHPATKKRARKCTFGLRTRDQIEQTVDFVLALDSPGQPFGAKFGL